VPDATREFIRKFEMTAISTLEPVQDRHFKDETVKLDGKRFLSCSFDGCTLNYSGGDVEFGPGCSVENCRPIFSGPARRTVHCFARLVCSRLTRTTKPRIGPRNLPPPTIETGLIFIRSIRIPFAPLMFAPH
jgi:hypothetical protein